MTHHPQSEVSSAADVPPAEPDFSWSIVLPSHWQYLSPWENTDELFGYAEDFLQQCGYKNAEDNKTFLRALLERAIHTQAHHSLFLPITKDGVTAAIAAIYVSWRNDANLGASVMAARRAPGLEERSLDNTIQGFPVDLRDTTVQAWIPEGKPDTKDETDSQPLTRAVVAIPQTTWSLDVTGIGTAEDIADVVASTVRQIAFSMRKGEVR
ncbi:hypothetical protein [Corynebacterium cystitidis]|uniref:Uncharacterized protein n=1 Tax=Corynebacterium cystitidis DSM 20524 TaxID=1121357 RepID=A0A1H9UV52_9CORY|nr:hypothetical protein [Corynebacterium cystitidis]WJY83696.1 hypothetical protein CCYS_14075 [Corynebacterium cystitidis DSM 20524]SES13231.1 hypothetical protein SAMN05661109_01940 [Corynebacterium cystitidis DSM 20524]SNV91267.1 Uncharacterised protein [Corynebacterium cystitidis]